MKRIFDKDGYDQRGFNKKGVHFNGTLRDNKGYDVDGYNENGYDENGFDREGNHINGTKYNEFLADTFGCGKTGYDIAGFDKQGYMPTGYDKEGYDRDGFDRKGFNKDGMNRNQTMFDENGYDINGYNVEGYNKDGFNSEGIDKDGYNKRGFNKEGLTRTGARYDVDGFDVNGYDKDGFNEWNKDHDGYNREGYNDNGFNREGIHFNKTKFDENGYDIKGYDKDGYNKFGRDKDGYDRNGRNEQGFTREEIENRGNEQRKTFRGLLEKVEKLTNGEMTLEEYALKSKYSIDELIMFAKRQNMDVNIVKKLYKFKKPYEAYKKPFNKEKYLKSTIVIVNGKEVRPTEQDVNESLKFLNENGAWFCDKTVKDTIRKYLRGELNIKEKIEDDLRKEKLVKTILKKQNTIKAQESEIENLQKEKRRELMNNGLIEYKKSFVSKIKDFFKNLFGMKKANDVIPKVEDEVAVINDRTNKFLNEIRVENNDLEKINR